MPDRPTTETPPIRNLPVPVSRSMKKRSWSLILVWLGAFLAGVAVAGIVVVALLLRLVEPQQTAVVFQPPASRPAASAPATQPVDGHGPPSTAVAPDHPAEKPVAENPAPGTEKPATEKPQPEKTAAADHAPPAGPAPAAPPPTGREAPAHGPPGAEIPAAPPAAAGSTPSAAAGSTPSAAAGSTPPHGPPEAVAAIASGGGGGGGALAPAPDPQLIERTSDGVLPIAGVDGRLPWQVYGRPFRDAQKRPRVAITITGLGLSDLATQNAIERLPPEVSLGFSPYAKRLGDWIQLARTVGHEVLLDVPLEPDDPENQDPGPDTLLSTQPPARNIARLHAIMGRVTGYVGLIPSRSDRFANVPAALRPVLDDLRARGLLVLDTSSTTLAAAPPSLVRVGADLIVDVEPSPASIDQRLADLEAAAKRNGAAAGIGRSFPVTLTAITSWAAGLDKRGFALAPVTAIVRR